MNDDASARQIINFIKTKKSAFWEEEQRRRTLSLFHEAARRVPAYKDFLKKNHTDPQKIKTLGDFAHVPPVSKKDYLRKYPMEKLCWDGTLNDQFVFTSTSGSTGEPFYFPRTARLDWESSIIHQIFLENSSYGAGEPTLVLVCFGMGAWIGGVLTYKAFEIAAKRGNYPVSIFTPGVNKEEIFKALATLAPRYKQVILTGYPPFIKDILDEAPERGIDIHKMNMRILFAAEAFSEAFRDYIVKSVKIKNVYQDTLNVYGTADIGTMAYETPGAILVRRLAAGRRPLFEKLFAAIQKTPTLTQYNPSFTSFEAVGGEILLTGDNAMPLVRYAIGDRGGVRSFSEVERMLRAEGLDLRREAAKANVPLYELPFVYVYERCDFSIKLRLHDVYPEIIRDVLIAPKMRNILTGKFTMVTRYDQRQDQYLELNLELKKGKRPGKDFVQMVHRKVLDALRTKASGPGTSHGLLNGAGLVKIIPWPAEHPLHFEPCGKQAWVKR